MSLLKSVQSGVRDQALMWCFYGQPSSGKSTLASKFPSPLFLDVEDSTGLIPNVTRLTSKDLPNFESVVSVVDDLYKEKHDYKTVVIDSLTVLEKLAETFVCKSAKVTSMSSIPFGNGKVMLNENISQFVAKLKNLQLDKNINIIFTAHAKIKSFSDPMLTIPYDRFSIQASDSIANIIEGACDCVIFCKFDVEVMATKNGKGQGYSEGNRILLTEYRAGHMAKNRLALPYQINNDYDALVKAMADSKPRPSSQLKADITELLLMTDEVVAVKVRKALDDAGDDNTKLSRIKAKLVEINQAGANANA